MNEVSYLSHHGIKGQKWGVRRYQNEDGTLTEEGKIRKNRNRKLLIGSAIAITALSAAAVISNYKSKKSKGDRIPDEFIRSLYDRGIMERKKVETGKSYLNSLIANAGKGALEGFKATPESLRVGVREGIKGAVEGGPKKLIKVVGTGATLIAGKKVLDRAIGEKKANEIYKYGKAKEK